MLYRQTVNQERQLALIGTHRSDRFSTRSTRSLTAQSNPAVPDDLPVFSDDFALAKRAAKIPSAGSAAMV